LLISIGSAKTRIQLNLIQLSVLTLFLMLILVTHISVKIRLPFTQLYKEYKLRLENYSLSHRERWAVSFDIKCMFNCVCW